MKNGFSLFNVEKPIIGMIHCAGENRKEKLQRALEELTIYEEEGVDGAIIEDYHGNVFEVMDVLKSSRHSILKGVNLLSHPYASFEMAYDFEGGFVQFDSVQENTLDIDRFSQLRKKYPSIYVLGGIRFKYIEPSGKRLEEDIADGKKYSDIIVTTGEGTGIETPLDKLYSFRRYLSNFPFFVGAGVTINNLKEQLTITDGAIVGSYFKNDNKTHNYVDRGKVRSFMDSVRKIRNDIRNQ